MHYAIIKPIGDTLKVDNVIVWDGEAAYEEPNGLELVAIEPAAHVGIGWTYVDGAFVAPPQPPVEDLPLD